MGKLDVYFEEEVRTRVEAIAAACGLGKKDKQITWVLGSFGIKTTEERLGGIATLCGEEIRAALYSLEGKIDPDFLNRLLINFGLMDPGSQVVTDGKPSFACGSQALLPGK